MGNAMGWWEVQAEVRLQRTDGEQTLEKVGLQYFEDLALAGARDPVLSAGDGTFFTTFMVSPVETAWEAEISGRHIVHQAVSNVIHRGGWKVTKETTTVVAAVQHTSS